MSYPIEIKDKANNTKGIKIEAFRKNVRTTAPHKHHSYIELVYLSAGSGKHTIDADTFIITPPVLHIIQQEQLHFWNIDSDPAGYVLILKKTFVDQYFDHELNYLLSRLSTCSAVNIDPGKAPVIESLFELLVQENKGTEKENAVLIHLMKALLTKLLQQLPTSVTKPPGNLYFSFCEQLSASKSLINNVAYYARQLHTSPQNLNAACKRQAGKPASVILSAHIVSEASRLLLYTQQSVSEIAYRLGFKDNSHFTKYFKKHTGSTPSQLRLP
ncbi:MAG TPA: helix-turn-helix transcriptional regulator [Niabella sp.]|nr:helix-turn-helix transcriptional regulator [Niabella sp.]